MVYFLQKSYRIQLMLLTVALLLIAHISTAQVRFTTTANETEIGKNDLVQIKFKIENARSVYHITPPPFDGFEIVSGPNQETGSFSSSGLHSSYVAISYILRPQKPGKFIFNPATAVIDGKEMTSNKITIRVSNQGTVKATAPNSLNQSPFSGFDISTAPSRRVNEDCILGSGEDAEKKIRENLFLKIDANKTSCFVGEPVVVSFKLYTRLLSQTSITDAPLFNGFSVSEMDVDDKASEVRINGKKFNCYTLRKVQLFPMQAGNFSISPLKSNNKVTFVKSEKQLRQHNDDPFGTMIQELGAQDFAAGSTVAASADLASNSITIHVKPLPESSKPENFKGAVGSFSMQGTLLQDSMTTDDAGSLSLTITGSGNLNLINAPKINWPSGIDVYDAKIKEDIDNQQVPATGTKTFNIPFTVSKSGNYSVPPIHFTWFNPQSGRYDSSVTEPVTLFVAAGRKLQFAAASAGKNPPFSLLSVSALEWAGGIVLVGGLAVLAGFVLFKKKNRESELESQIRLDDLKHRQSEEFDIPGNPLQKAQEKLDTEDPESFYKALESCVRNYLSVKLEIPLHELSSEKVIEKMDNFNVGIGTTRLFESLIREIDLGLYARRSHATQMRNLYEKSSELIALLNKQICAK